MLLALKQQKYCFDNECHKQGCGFIEKCCRLGEDKDVLGHINYKPPASLRGTKQSLSYTEPLLCLCKDLFTQV